MQYTLQRIEKYVARPTILWAVNTESRAGRIAAGVAQRCDEYLDKHPPRTPNGRVVLAPRVYPEAVVLDQVEARSWLEAKRKLGFPLTSRQELILQRRRQAA